MRYEKSAIKVQVGVNAEILENKERRNFWTITVMYIKVYTFGMEMSQRIHLLKKLDFFFWQNGKKSLFW